LLLKKYLLLLLMLKMDVLLNIFVEIEKKITLMKRKFNRTAFI